MIRLYDPDKDVENILEIWLQASIISHDFMPKDFWESKLDDMRNIYIPYPGCENWVIEPNDIVLGFFALCKNRIEAIFVHPNSQGHGLGQSLMDKAKSLRANLELCVFSSNKRSIDFYNKQGFKFIKEQVDKHTGHNELLLKWSR